MTRHRTLILASLLGTLPLVPIVASAVNSWLNRRSIKIEIEQNNQELAKLADAQAWRPWFVLELQRHDRALHLKPLPYPGNLDWPAALRQYQGLAEPTTEPGMRTATQP